MSLPQLAIFATAYFAVLILPGPGVTALVARVLACGAQGAPAFIAGFVAGALSWLTIATTGLAVLATSFATLFLTIRYAGAAYLLYLAYRFWVAPPRSLEMREVVPVGRGRLFLTGLAINLGNPKVMVFFLALLPTVVDLGSLTPGGFALLAVTASIIATGVLTAYAVVAARARRVFASSDAVRLVNRGSSVVMAGTAVSIAIR